MLMGILRNTYKEVDILKFPTRLRSTAVPLSDYLVRSKSLAKECRHIFFLPCCDYVSIQLYTRDKKKLNM